MPVLRLPGCSPCRGHAARCSAADTGRAAASAASQLQRSSHQIFMIQMDAESSPSPRPPCRQVALLTASITSAPAAHREGLEGPSLTRLREAPPTEIFKSRQDSSLVTTPKRPVLPLAALCGLASVAAREEPPKSSSTAPNGDGQRLLNHFQCRYGTGPCDSTQHHETATAGASLP